mmetsp:Transcript_68945/g.135373  ORF Transcript_68945/g.135373 Transcript_68945/m.135373 type:complete len:332 (+) Transcript_68945:67-1062(+)
MGAPRRRRASPCLLPLCALLLPGAHAEALGARRASLEGALARDCGSGEEACSASTYMLQSAVRSGVKSSGAAQAAVGAGAALAFPQTGQTVEPGAGAGPRFASYVITVAFQPERWECISRQLASAPEAVHKKEALPSSECPGMKTAPGLWMLDQGRNTTAVSSLFCTNLHVWKAAVESDADFVVIFEDDTILAPSFWQEVRGFVTDCADFDYVVLDTAEPDGSMNHPDHERAETCASAGRWKLYRPSGLYRHKGTTVQLIRREFLPTMISLAEEHGMMPLDAWWAAFLLQGGRAFAWQAGVAFQSSMDAASRLPVPEGCPEHTRSLTSSRW